MLLPAFVGARFMFTLIIGFLGGQAWVLHLFVRENVTLGSFYSVQR